MRPFIWHFRLTPPRTPARGKGAGAISESTPRTPTGHGALRLPWLLSPRALCAHLALLRTSLGFVLTLLLLGCNPPDAAIYTFILTPSLPTTHISDGWARASWHPSTIRARRLRLLRTIRPRASN